MVASYYSCSLYLTMKHFHCSIALYIYHLNYVPLLILLIPVCQIRCHIQLLPMATQYIFAQLFLIIYYIIQFIYTGKIWNSSTEFPCIIECEQCCDYRQLCQHVHTLTMLPWMTCCGRNQLHYCRLRIVLLQCCIILKWL